MIKVKKEPDLKEFIARWKTIPAPDEKPQYPYSEYWVKAVMCILLSGRVKPTSTGAPNRTDIERVCKQANFNQRLFEDTARLLIKSGAIAPHGKFNVENYREEKNCEAFLNHDLRKIQSAAKAAFLDLVQDFTGFRAWRPTLVTNSGLVDFLILFFECFQGRALPSGEIGKIFLAFSKLPEEIFSPLMNERGIKDIDLYSCESWLDEKGQQSLLAALYVMGWAYATEYQKKDWIYLSATGRTILGFTSAPLPPALSTEFKALSNLCVLAGIGLPFKILIPLFRHCRIIRIDNIVEFRLDKKVMQEVPAKTSAGEELLNALKELEPLPSTIKAFLNDKQQIKTGSVLHVNYCSAIVRPEDPQMLHIIEQHPKLKGYLAHQSPPGYLLIKYGSSADNFVRKCKEYGFELKFL